MAASTSSRQNDLVFKSPQLRYNYIMPPVITSHLLMLGTTRVFGLLTPASEPWMLEAGAAEQQYAEFSTTAVIPFGSILTDASSLRWRVINETSGRAPYLYRLQRVTT